MMDVLAFSFAMPPTMACAHRFESRRMFRRLFQVIALALVLTAFSACGLDRATPGTIPKPELRDDTVQKVMSYLHAKDVEGLQNMAFDEFVGVAYSANDWVATWGGVQDTGYEVSYESPGGTTYYHTTIRATAADGKPIEIRISLSWAVDHWAVGRL